jgi:hypothetical protein
MKAELLSARCMHFLQEALAQAGGLARIATRPSEELNKLSENTAFISHTVQMYACIDKTSVNSSLVEFSIYLK